MAGVGGQVGLVLVVLVVLVVPVVGGGGPSRQVFTQPSKQQKPLSGQSSSEGVNSKYFDKISSSTTCVSQAGTPAG